LCKCRENFWRRSRQHKPAKPARGVGRGVDCKTVVFFLKISKEISKAWRKSLARASHARDSLHRNLANGNCPWLGDAGNSIEYNVCKTDSPYFLASLSSLALCLQPRSRPFCSLGDRVGNSQNFFWYVVTRSFQRLTCYSQSKSHSNVLNLQ